MILPAFKERGAKFQLDQNIIDDIVQYVNQECGATETAIRGVITSKCADENKMMKINERKRASMSSVDLECSPMANKRRSMNH